MTEAGHPFIVQLHGAFQDDQYVYFVLEYMGGGDLFSHMASLGQSLVEEQTRIVAAETALALEHLHSLGYMYRDLKPENILCASPPAQRTASPPTALADCRGSATPAERAAQAPPPQRVAWRPAGTRRPMRTRRSRWPTSGWRGSSRART